MGNIIPFPGANQEHHSKLSGEQREAIVGRWPIRFTTGQALVDRGLWVMYRETVAAPATVTPQQERSIGSNVVSMEAKRQAKQATTEAAQLHLNEPEADAQVYDLDEIRRVVRGSFPIQPGESYDQEAA